jgi:hypothetical protein
MPHIALPEGLPGISTGFAFRPETAKPMRELAHVLLHGPSTLTGGERELMPPTSPARMIAISARPATAPRPPLTWAKTQAWPIRSNVTSPIAGLRQTQGAAGDCWPRPEGWQAGNC